MWEIQTKNRKKLVNIDQLDLALQNVRNMAWESRGWPFLRAMQISIFAGMHMSAEIIDEWYNISTIGYVHNQEYSKEDGLDRWHL